MDAAPHTLFVSRHARTADPVLGVADHPLSSRGICPRTAAAAVHLPAEMLDSQMTLSLTQEAPNGVRYCFRRI